MYERQNKEMDQGGRNPSVQDHGADRGGHAAGGGNDHGGGLADRVGTAALAGVASILTSLAGLPELDKVS